MSRRTNCRVKNPCQPPPVTSASALWRVPIATCSLKKNTFAFSDVRISVLTAPASPYKSDKVIRETSSDVALGFSSPCRKGQRRRLWKPRCSPPAGAPAHDPRNTRGKSAVVFPTFFVFRGWNFEDWRLIIIWGVFGGLIKSCINWTSDLAVCNTDLYAQLQDWYGTWNILENV